MRPPNYESSTTRRLARVEALQAGQRVIERQHVDRVGVRRRHAVGERDAHAVAAPFLGAPPPRPFDQDAAYHARGQAQEVRAVTLIGVGPGQAQICFVHEQCGLQGMPGYTRRASWPQAAAMS